MPILFLRLTRLLLLALSLLAIWRGRSWSDAAAKDIGADAHHRTRATYLVGGSVGLLIAFLDIAWSYHAIDHWSWTSSVLDFVVASYVCVLILLLQRDLRLGIPLAITVSIGAYMAAVAKYEILHAKPEFADLLQVDDLFMYYGTRGGWYWMAIFAVLVMLALLVVANLRRPRLHEFGLILPALAFGLVIVGKTAAPAQTAAIIEPIRTSHSWFPDTAVYGQWVSFLRSTISYADRQNRLIQLRQSATPNPAFIGERLGQPSRRNVYMIMLESMIDPTTIAGVQYSEEPLSPMFVSWREMSNLRSMQPVIGDRSPDGEFEALCGMPVTLDESQVIFAQLTVDTMDCLPRKLAELGWVTESWHPVAPEVFNNDNAYKKFGFQRRVFIDDVDNSDQDGEGPSAQSLLQQNLEHVQELLNGGKPFFNYVFVTAGHFPYVMDQAKRPYQVEITPPSHFLRAFVNCAYYTTRAVDTYVEEVRRIDPSAIIVILGDHPPALPVQSDGIAYPRPISIRYDVPLLIFDGERGALPLTGQLPGYQIPGIIADLMTEGAFCQTGRCFHREPLAFRPLLEGLLVVNRDDHSILDCAASAESQVCRDAKAFTDGTKLKLYEFVGLK